MCFMNTRNYLRQMCRNNPDLKVQSPRTFSLRAENNRALLSDLVTHGTSEPILKRVSGDVLPRAEGELSSPRASAGEDLDGGEESVSKIRADPQRADRTQCFTDVPSAGNAVGSSYFFPHDSINQLGHCVCPPRRNLKGIISSIRHKRQTT